MDGIFRAASPPVLQLAPPQNFFVRHWKGQTAPGWSVLTAFGSVIFPTPFLLSFAVSFGVSFYAAFAGQRFSPSAAATITIPAAFLISAWALVGAFRSGWNNRRTFLGIAGLVGCVLLTLISVGSLGQLFVVQTPQHQVRHR